MRRVLQALVCAWLLGAAATGVAGETSVEPSGSGVDLLQDTTGDEDARSSETSAAAEDLVEPVAAHPHDVPLADAVTTAEGQAETLTLLGVDLEPGGRARR